MLKGKRILAITAISMVVFSGSGVRADRAALEVVDPNGTASELRNDDAIPTGHNVRLILSSPTASDVHASVSSLGAVPNTAQKLTGTRRENTYSWNLLSLEPGAYRIDVAVDGLPEGRKISRSFILVGEREAALAFPNLSELNADVHAKSSLSHAAMRFPAEIPLFAGSLGDELKVDEPLLFRGSGVSLYARVASSVVKVLTNEGSGSGSVISKRGEILTNWHVVKGYRTVGIRFKPRNRFGVSSDHMFIATVTKIDEVADLALLKLKDKVGGVAPVILHMDGEPDVGEEVHAIGHPQGQNWTYTRGYISQVRENFEWAADESRTHRATVIQTQTPINPGNSGGPLLNDSGQLIGVNSFIRTDSQGLNYAVSVANVRSFLKSKRSRKLKKVRYPKNSTIDRRKVLRAADENGNGVIDTVFLDSNGNGVGDMVVVDMNEDGEPDYMLLDTDENGRTNLKITPVMKDGRLIYLMSVDKDEDGKADAYCVDFDGDFEADRCRKASG